MQAKRQCQAANAGADDGDIVLMRVHAESFRPRRRREAMPEKRH
jgi:hypothetical protein